MVIEKDVVAVGPQPAFATDEIPHLAERRAPCGTDCTRCDRAPHRGQYARLNALHLNGNGHTSILNQRSSHDALAERHGSLMQGADPAIDSRPMPLSLGTNAE